MLLVYEYLQLIMLIFEATSMFSVVNVKGRTDLLYRSHCHLGWECKQAFGCILANKCLSAKVNHCA